MKRIKTISFIVLIGISLSGHAQEETNNLDILYRDYLKIRTGRTFSSQKYKGSPYLNELFSPGTVKVCDGKCFHGVLFRYNVYSDNFEFLRNEIIYVPDCQDEKLIFSFDEKSFAYRTYFYNKKQQAGYLEVLFNSTYSLYCKYNVLLKDAVSEGPFQVAEKASFNHTKPSFLIGKEGGPIVKVDKLKDLVKAFPELEDPIGKISSKKKVKLKRRDDYTELIKNLDSLFHVTHKG